MVPRYRMTYEANMTRNEEGKQGHLKSVFDGFPVMKRKFFCMLLIHANVRTRSRVAMDSLDGSTLGFARQFSQECVYETGEMLRK